MFQHEIFAHIIFASSIWLPVLGDFHVVGGKNKLPKFPWSNRMVKQLINFIQKYKTAIEFKNVEFNTGVMALYSCTVY